VAKRHGQKGRFIVKVFAVILTILAFWLPETALAQQATIPLVSTTPNATGGSDYALGIQILLVMTVLTLLPAMLITMTSFTRVLIVLAILRQAMGTAQTPSNQIILGLSLFLSLFIMAPVFDVAWTTALQPFLDGAVGFEGALEAASIPFREFMFTQTRDSDLTMFAEMGGYGAFASQDDVPMFVLLPSFLVSELKTAFQIGFLLFVPFLVIDLVVAAILMAMGMMMLSPIIISLPFKLMLFVLIDGWALVTSTLVRSFAV
jgi:flagellar biosynthetic protein FliP